MAGQQSQQEQSAVTTMTSEAYWMAMKYFRVMPEVLHAWLGGRSDVSGSGNPCANPEAVKMYLVALSEANSWVVTDRCESLRGRALIKQEMILVGEREFSMWNSRTKQCLSGWGGALLRNVPRPWESAYAHAAQLDEKGDWVPMWQVPDNVFHARLEQAENEVFEDWCAAMGI